MTEPPRKGFAKIGSPLAVGIGQPRPVVARHSVDGVDKQQLLSWGEALAQWLCARNRCVLGFSARTPRSTGYLSSRVRMFGESHGRTSNGIRTNFARNHSQVISFGISPYSSTSNVLFLPKSRTDFLRGSSKSVTFGELNESVAKLPDTLVTRKPREKALPGFFYFLRPQKDLRRGFLRDKNKVRADFLEHVEE